MLVKLTDLEADRRVGRDGRYHPHRTVRRSRRALVRKGRRRRPVDVAVVGLTVRGRVGGGAGPVVAAASFVEAVSEAGQAGAQRSEAVL